MKGKNSFPIYSWTDVIDADHYAVVTRCYFVKRSTWFGMSVFTIVNRNDCPRWDRSGWQKIGMAKWHAELMQKFGGRVPVICHVTSPGARECGLA